MLTEKMVSTSNDGVLTHIELLGTLTPKSYVSERTKREIWSEFIAIEGLIGRVG